MGSENLVQVPREQWDGLFAPSSLLAVITTVDAEGTVNAAPVGTCTRVVHDPVCLAFTIGAGKDTYNNVLETEQFVVNVPSFDPWQLERVAAMGLVFSPEVNELEVVGLTAIESQIVRPPAIAEFSRHFECKVLWTKEWMGRLMVVGEVVAATAHANILAPEGGILWEEARSAHYCGTPYKNRFVAAYETLDVSTDAWLASVR